MKPNAKVITLVLLIAFLRGAAWYWFAGRAHPTSVSYQSVRTSLECVLNDGRAGNLERVQRSTGGNVDAADAQTNQAFVSHHSLQTSLERALEAGRAGDLERVRQSTGWIVDADVPSTASEEMHEVLTGHFIRSVSRASRMRVVNQLQESSGIVRARIERTAASGVVTRSELRFVREAGEWKPAFKISRSTSGGYGGAFLLDPTPALDSTNQTANSR